MQEVKKYIGDEVSKIIVGNKKDVKDRAVTEEEGKDLADMYCCQYLETSAKSSFGV